MKKLNLMKISWEPSPLEIMIQQKEPANVQCFNYLSSIRTNNSRPTCETKSRVPTTKTAFTKKNTTFPSKLGLNRRKKRIICYIRSVGLTVLKPGNLESRLEKTGKF